MPLDFSSPLNRRRCIATTPLSPPPPPRGVKYLPSTTTTFTIVGNSPHPHLQFLLPKLRRIVGGGRRPSPSPSWEVEFRAYLVPRNFCLVTGNSDSKDNESVPLLCHCHHPQPPRLTIATIWRLLSSIPDACARVVDVPVVCPGIRRPR